MWLGPPRKQFSFCHFGPPILRSFSLPALSIVHGYTTTLHYTITTYHSTTVPISIVCCVCRPQMKLMCKQPDSPLKGQPEGPLGWPVRLTDGSIRGGRPVRIPDPPPPLQTPQSFRTHLSPI